eukprot:1157139-Pelagomonas_calceolata.AAC.2
MVYAIPRGWMRAKSEVKNIYEKAVSSKAKCKKALVLLEAPSRCEEHCHKLASTERLRSKAFAIKKN